jgi:hypothetical protein
MRGAAGTGGRKTSKISKTKRRRSRSPKRSEFLFLVIFPAIAKNNGLSHLFFFLNFDEFSRACFEREFLNKFLNKF